MRHAKSVRNRRNDTGQVVNRTKNGDATKFAIDKRREDILPVISAEVRRLADAEKNLIRAHATFAVTPTTAECDDLKVSLEKRTGKSIQLTHEVNDEIIGGVVVRMHDNIIDGSVRGSLEKMRVSLLQDA